MFGYKVYINYILWRFGIRNVLPAAFINRILVKENSEKLVDIKKSGFFFSDELSKRKNVFLRTEAFAKLKTAQSKLPDGVFIKIYSAFRPLTEQKELWDFEIKKLRKLNPKATTSEITALAKLSIANPDNGGGGHQTGGAIDVSLCDKNGRDLDMDGGWIVFNEKTPTKAIKNKNRKLLCKVMAGAGFVNYPKEWWHFSYGDKMWAAYSRKKIAIYDSVS